MTNESLSQVAGTAVHELKSGVPWLKLTYDGVKKDSTAESVELHKHTLTLMPSQMTRWEVNENDLMNVIRFQPELAVWSTEGHVQDWYKEMTDPDTFVVLLAEGLASNHNQWSNEGISFVHRLAQKFEKEVKPYYSHSGKRPKLVMVAVSCPGFGGSVPIDGGTLSEDEVSDASYARYLRSVARLLTLPLGQTVFTGHSAGAEAILTQATDNDNSLNVPNVAIHPSVGEELQGQFQALYVLDTAGKVVPQKLVEPIEERIIRHMVGIRQKGKLTPAESAQLAMHRQEKKHQAFRPKTHELARPGKPRTFELAEGTVPPIVITGEKDVLTPQETIEKWIAAADINTRLERFGVHITDFNRIEAQLEKDLVERRLIKGDWGHDAVFIDQKAQDIATGTVCAQLEPLMVDRNPVYSEIYELLMYLRNEGFPVHIKYVAGTGAGIKKDSEAYLRALESGDPQKVYEHVRTLKWSESFLCRLQQAQVLVNSSKIQDIVSGWKTLMEENNPIPEDQIRQVLSLRFDTMACRPYFRTQAPIDTNRPLDEVIYQYMLHHSDLFIESQNIDSVWGNNLYYWLSDSYEADRFTLFAMPSIFYALKATPSSFHTQEEISNELKDGIHKMLEANIASYVKDFKTGARAPVKLEVTLNDLMILDRLSRMQNSP